MEILERIKIWKLYLIHAESEASYRSNLWKINVYNFLMGIYVISGLIIPLYFIWGHLSLTQFLILQAYYVFIILILQIPIGALADKVSKKLTLFFSGLCSAIATLIYCINKPTIFLFIVGETFFACGEALMMGSTEAIVYDTLGKLGRQNEIGKIMARTNGTLLAAMTVSAFVGSLIISYFSIPTIMLFMFFPYVFASIISLLLKESKREEKEIRLNYVNTLKTGFKGLRHNKILRVLSLDMISIEILVMFIIYSYQVYLYKLNVPVIYFGFIASSFNLMQIIFTNVLPKFEKKIKNKRRYLIMNTLIPGIGYILMGITCLAPLIIVLCLIVVGFGFSRYIIFVKGINDQIEFNYRATTLNTINTIKLFLRILLFPVIGFLVVLNLNVIFIFIGALIIVLAFKSGVKKEYL